MYKRTLSFNLKNGRWWFAFLFLGFLSNCITSAAPITVNASNSTYFIANEGQWEGDFQFKCEVGSTVYYVTPKGMTVDFREFRKYSKPRDPRNPLDMLDKQDERDSVTVRGHVVQIHYVDGSTRSISVGEGRLPHYSNYFLGRDSTKWRSRVGHYQNIIVPEVWPGIDIEYRADKQGVEAVYHVKPGANPTQIQMEYIGLDAPLRVDTQGNLILTTSLGDVKEKAPFAFQQEARMQERVDAEFRVVDETRIGYDVGEFDAGKELVVDPLLYGTYLGAGSLDYGGPLAPAPDGGVYVTGMTYALSGFPTTPGAYDETGLFPGSRPFVSLFNSDGGFIASTLFGEIQTSENRTTEAGAYDIVYDSIRDGVWMCGVAYPDWPLTPDAIDTTIRGLYDVDAFLLRFSSDLTTLEYCTYIGGNHGDEAQGIALDGAGRIYIAGITYSEDFPTTPDALFSTRQEQDGFLWIYDPDTYNVLFSTYIGGERNDECWGVHLGSNGHVWLNGTTESEELPTTEGAFQAEFSDSDTMFWFDDAFFALITLDPPELEYCSYLGGENSSDFLGAIFEVDSIIYLTGFTSSPDFPISAGAFDTVGPISGAGWDTFVSRLNWTTGSYTATFVGVDRYQFGLVYGNWVGDDYVLVGGYTNSDSLPITPNAYDTEVNHGQVGPGDAFVVRLNRELSEPQYGTYIGGSQSEEHIFVWAQNRDSVWICGTTESFDLPVTPNAFQAGDNAFISAFVQHFAIDTTADTTSATRGAPISTDFSLSAYPNPFNPETSITFKLPRTSDVKIIVHNVLGREVGQWGLGRLTAGHHEYRLNGAKWASGVYILTLKTIEDFGSTKLLLIR